MQALSQLGCQPRRGLKCASRRGIGVPPTALELPRTALDCPGAGFSAVLDCPGTALDCPALVRRENPGPLSAGQVGAALVSGPDDLTLCKRRHSPAQGFESGPGTSERASETASSPDAYSSSAPTDTTATINRHGGNRGAGLRFGGSSFARGSRRSDGAPFVVVNLAFYVAGLLAPLVIPGGSSVRRGEVRGNAHHFVAFQMDPTLCGLPFGSTDPAEAKYTFVPSTATLKGSPPATAAGVPPARGTL
jgi:hypothetical protein